MTLKSAEACREQYIPSGDLLLVMKRDPDANGWLSSAQSWIARMPEAGDFAREHILDRPMLERTLQAGPRFMLDIGCGEGRFCRIVGRHGVQVTGIDPVQTLIDRAKQLDPNGTYYVGFAEDLPFIDESFDLVVFYLSLLDIDDFRRAVAEAVRVLHSSGTLLIANLNSFFTSNGTIGWIETREGEQHFLLGTYLEEKAEWFEWDGLRVRNWHRPLSVYMSVLIDAGLVLTCFDEPHPTGGPTALH